MARWRRVGNPIKKGEDGVPEVGRFVLFSFEIRVVLAYT
jgi:hypothetical protein